MKGRTRLQPPTLHRLNAALEAAHARLFAHKREPFQRYFDEFFARCPDATTVTVNFVDGIEVSIEVAVDLGDDNAVVATISEYDGAEPLTTLSEEDQTRFDDEIDKHVDRYYELIEEIRYKLAAVFHAYWGCAELVAERGKPLHSSDD